MQEPEIFADLYAGHYDSVYAAKDYESECDVLERAFTYWTSVDADTGKKIEELVRSGREGDAPGAQPEAAKTDAGTPVCCSITLAVLRSPGKVELTRSPSGMVARTVRTSCGGVVMSARI